MALATLQLFLNEGKQSKKNNSIPIYARIFLHGKKAEAKTIVKIDPQFIQFWNKQDQRFDRQFKAENAKLSVYRDRFDKVQLKYLNNTNGISARQFLDELIEEKREKVLSVLTYINNVFESDISLNVNVSNGTKKNYKNAFRHLDNFFRHNHISNIAVADFDSTQAKAFLSYLESNIDEIINYKGEKEKKIGLAASVAAGNIKKIKTIFEKAVETKIILYNPFYKIKLVRKSPPKIKLTTGELLLLAKHDFTNFENLEKVRDIFMFSVFTGLSYSDAMGLNIKHFHSTTENGYLVVVNRQKSKIETMLFLVQQAKDIIDKYQQQQKINMNGYLLPRMSNQQLNFRLKILAEKVGIHTNLTSHLARHLFSQLVRSAGITDALTKNKMMGHSSRNNIREIYETVDENELFEAKEKFQLYLNKILKKDESNLS